jgi:hypothetical protein
VNAADHHSTYLARAVAALTPEGRKRVDELLDQLAVAGRHREWVVRFALAREAEADAGQIAGSAADEPGAKLSNEELDVLTAGFMTIRDRELLDDVADWANAVLALGSASVSRNRVAREPRIRRARRLGMLADWCRLACARRSRHDPNRSGRVTLRLPCFARDRPA